MKQIVKNELALLKVKDAGQSVTKNLVIDENGNVLQKDALDGSVPSEDIVFMFKLSGDFFEQTHTVGLTASDVHFLVVNADFQGGNTLVKRSTTDDNHFHDVTFYYDSYENKFRALDITAAGDVIHRCVPVTNEPVYFETYLSISKGDLYNQFLITARGNIDYAFNRSSVGVYDATIQDLDNYSTMFLIGGAPGVKVIKTGDRTFTIETRDDQGVLSNDILDNFGLIIRIYS